MCARSMLAMHSATLGYLVGTGVELGSRTERTSTLPQSRRDGVANSDAPANIPASRARLKVCPGAAVIRCLMISCLIQVKGDDEWRPILLQHQAIQLPTHDLGSATPARPATHAAKDPLMKLQLNALLPATALALAGLLLSGVAGAHISLEKGGGLKSRNGDVNLKAGPCGLAGSKRGTNIYTYAPGETVDIKITETIPHPSYFRIAFDKDGDDGFVDPKSIKPIDPARPCPFNADDKCGTTDAANDFYNTPEVLMDNLDPHLSNSRFGSPYSWQVTLPNVTCDNCTLQIIQVMEDTVHGAYNPDPADPSLPDIYHQCLDVVLDGPLQPTDDAGATGGVKTTAPASKDSGGCSVGAARASGARSTGYAALLGLALVGARRRTRSRRVRVD